MKKGHSDELKRLMAQHGLTTAQVAEMCGCSVWTVYGWRSQCAMPARQLKLLKLMLKDRGASA